MRTATILFYCWLGGVAAHRVPRGEVVGAVDLQQLIYDRGDVRHDVALPPPILVKGTTSTSASSSLPTITPRALGVHKRQAQTNVSTTAVMNSTTTTMTTTSSVLIPATAA
ncbi:BZ3500_MvSof-1268-A1-R1_Chr7-1g09045 [Microbotryum saponariae]|uniref:BZ3500_MvSof-1268-A1-R1_Chr7-1g09045 protein n=1 Tax=Microbotryum saponariae TaxID=289078 RepID=A0A2X0LPP3_9BASI|nr:BZ3501_MvSof-1269-A2-R1_Chr7-1g08749 [Microbotryum saponariae]SDA02684.1 BZ3500_MvSof-1268-A1-R1_Chr7-1g09045 [Microbotryum saponariae]